MVPRSVVAAIAALTSSAAALYINGSVTAPCDSPLYCQGDILKAIELAHPFSDSKTFVDMPTTKPLDEVIAAFNLLTQPLSNNSELNDFLAANFAPAGGELEEVPISELQTNPVFLDKVNDAVIKDFTNAVIKIWPDLTRRYAGPGNCSDCANSFIPVNHTFVVAGGRFREPYYWDSYWIVEGLLRTGGAFTQISKNTIENFLDLVEKIGFVPNGARVYYLNRSQPPLLSQMVRIYIEHTNDTSILARAVPLLIKEHEFWTNNRTVNVTAPNGKTYSLNRYDVDNNQPRPESYREDYITANNGSYYSKSGIIYPETAPLNDTEKAALYANLASGAESGWDYGTRWLARPNDAARDVYFPLRSVNTRSLVPVDLNSILYRNEVAISNFLKFQNNSCDALTWARKAADRSEGMYNLMWNATLWSYFDYNLTSNSQNIYIPADVDATSAELADAPQGYQVLFDIAQLYPFWTGAAPASLKNNPLAVQLAYRHVAAFLDEKAGGIPATNFLTGQQWDEPNVWPPLQHVLMEGLLNTPATFGLDDPAYVAVQNLSLRLAQRYLDSTFCTWYATGGSTSQTPKLQGLGPNATGTMFEKYADNATNVAGSGGEYTVVEGFGWTNGVLLWTVDTFGNNLTRPNCGNITAANVNPGKRSIAQRAVELDPWDAQWTKSFGKRALEKRET
ncbi:glycoside hydrolase family 37 protein [Cercophora scortea]|uniref:Trehalase n=1 Tax=Cercophora scortea TaxID=314031 RepID=A0AAE0J1S2_9PEZI|nr:glycoside hydrolase family 37 protein [Cercophora scortea]